jgi:hypothetical protein
MANNSDHRRRRERMDSIFAAVPMPPLGTPPGLRSNSHKRLKDSGPADSSDEEEAIPTTSQSAFERAKESSAWRRRKEEIAEISKVNFLAGLEKDDRGSVGERSKSLHSRSSAGGRSQRTLSINNRRPQNFNDRVESILDELKQVCEEQRQEQRPPSKPVRPISTPLSNFDEEEFSECASWDWGQPRHPHPAETPVIPVQVIRKRSKSQRHEISPNSLIRTCVPLICGDGEALLRVLAGVAPLQSIASPPITPRGHRKRTSHGKSVEHESFPFESPNTSRSRNLSDHQQRSPRTPSYQPKTPVSRTQGIRIPTARTKSPSGRSRSQGPRTPTSYRTKSPSSRHQRSRTPSSPVKSPTSLSQQTQRTPASRTKSPSCRSQRSRIPSSPVKSPGTSRSQRTQHTLTSPTKKSPSSRSQRTHQHQTPTSSRAKSPSGRSNRTRTPTSRAKSPSNRRSYRSYHQRTIDLPIIPPAPITPTGGALHHNLCFFSYGRPQQEFPDSALDRNAFSSRAHRNLMTDQIEQLQSDKTSGDDSGSSAGSTNYIIEKVRKWNQKHVREKRRSTTRSRKPRESFSCHNRTVTFEEFLSESEKNLKYLVQAKNRHEARRQLTSTDEGHRALKALHKSCLF